MEQLIFLLPMEQLRSHHFQFFYMQKSNAIFQQIQINQICTVGHTTLSTSIKRIYKVVPRQYDNIMFFFNFLDQSYIFFIINIQKCIYKIKKRAPYGRRRRPLRLPGRRRTQAVPKDSTEKSSQRTSSLLARWTSRAIQHICRRW